VRGLRWGLISHSFDWLNLLCDWEVALSDLVCDFLIGLDQIAAQAAACLERVNGEVSLNVISFSDLALLNELEGPWKTDTAGEKKPKQVVLTGENPSRLGSFRSL